MTHHREYTVRGVTGTLPELMKAFGVQVAESTVRTRMLFSSKGKGWDVERALLHEGRKPPLRPRDPTPIVRDEETIWEKAAKATRKRFDCSTREVLIALVAMGCSRGVIAEVTGLRLTRQHHKGLRKRVSTVRQNLGVQERPKPQTADEQLRRAWRRRSRCNSTDR